ncbi:MAG: leucyl/phenylalanyl-tRNA--protein transferase [Chitinophagales bacterium]
MPIYLLNDNLAFPPVEGAEEGIVAIGGDLSVERLLLAYQSGIFPWYSDGEPIIWHAPEQRFIIELDELHISRSMRRVLNSGRYSVTFDTNFSFVINQCASVERKEQEGTWITTEMIDAYTALHESGYAHSVEVWLDDEIVGGLYGVSLGKIFFAESMFHTASNASKVALIRLAEFLKRNDFHFIDAQVHTAHVESLGAKNIPRNEFMRKLRDGLNSKSITRKWQ